MRCLNTSNNGQYIYYNTTKAYPSINSTNGGQIHSEENVRWRTKQFTQKPFVIPDKDNKTLTPTGGAGNGLYINNGKVSIDGYTINIADNINNTSFDIDSKERFTLETQNVQRDLLEFIKGASIDFNDFVLDKYKPKDAEGNLRDNETMQENYKDLENADIIPILFGHISVTYNDLNINTELNNMIKDRLKKLKLKNKSDIAEESLETYDNPYIQSKTDNEVVIVYPVMYGHSDKYMMGVKENFIHFADIFDFVYIYDYSQKGETSSYPGTGNNFINMMADNVTPNSVSNIDRSTVSGGIKELIRIYTNTDENGINIRDTTTNCPYADKNTENTLADMFISISKEDIFGYGNKIIKDLCDGYYCLKESRDNDKLLPNGNPVPIAFMSSTGELVVKDITTTDTESNNIVLVESYVTWIKRQIQKINSAANSLKPDDINDHEAWIDIISKMNKTAFQGIYNTIAPYMNTYMQLSWTALIDKVVNANKFKSLHCGTELLINEPSKVTNDTLRCFSDYKAERMLSLGDTTEKETKTINYVQAMYTDRQAIDKYIRGEIVDLNPNAKTMHIAYLKDSPDNITESQCEDYISYIIRCKVPDDIKKGIKVDFAITNTIGRKVGYKFDIDSGDNYGYISNVLIDSLTFMPILHDSQRNTMFEHEYKYALELYTHLYLNHQGVMGNGLGGLCFRYNAPCWTGSLPLTIKLYKDSQKNLNGKDLSTDNIHKGIQFTYKMPYEIVEDDAWICNVLFKGNRHSSAYDIESNLSGSLDKFTYVTDYLKHRRQAFLHTDKIYGKDFKSFEELVSESIQKHLSDTESITLSFYTFKTLDVIDNANDIPTGKTVNVPISDVETVSGISDTIRRLDKEVERISRPHYYPYLQADTPSDELPEYIEMADNTFVDCTEIHNSIISEAERPGGTLRIYTPILTMPLGNGEYNEDGKSDRDDDYLNDYKHELVVKDNKVFKSTVKLVTNGKIQFHIIDNIKDEHGHYDENIYNLVPISCNYTPVKTKRLMSYTNPEDSSIVNYYEDVYEIDINIPSEKDIDGIKHASYIDCLIDFTYIRTGVNHTGKAYVNVSTLMDYDAMKPYRELNVFEINRALRSLYPLEQCTWKSIFDLCASRIASKLFRIGDTKTIRLKGMYDAERDNVYTQLTATLIAINADKYNEYSDDTLTFMITTPICHEVVSLENGKNKHLIKSKYTYNPENDTVYDELSVSKTSTKADINHGYLNSDVFNILRETEDNPNYSISDSGCIYNALAKVGVTKGMPKVSKICDTSYTYKTTDGVNHHVLRREYKASYLWTPSLSEMGISTIESIGSVTVIDKNGVIVEEDTRIPLDNRYTEYFNSALKTCIPDLSPSDKNEGTPWITRTPAMVNMGNNMSQNDIDNMFKGILPTDDYPLYLNSITFSNSSNTSQRSETINKGFLMFCFAVTSENGAKSLPRLIE